MASHPHVVTSIPTTRNPGTREQVQRVEYLMRQAQASPALRSGLIPLVQEFLWSARQEVSGGVDITLDDYHHTLSNILSSCQRTRFQSLLIALDTFTQDRPQLTKFDMACLIGKLETYLGLNVFGM